MSGIRVRVEGDLFHGRLPQRPGVPVAYVGRGAPGLPASPYANPHRIGLCRRCRLEHDQAGAVAAFTQDLADDPGLVAAARRDLSGDVACWCPLSPQALTCHGDVLVLVVAGADPGDLLTQLSGRPAEPVGRQLGRRQLVHDDPPTTRAPSGLTECSPPDTQG